MAEIIDTEEIDKDTVKPEDLDQLFNKKYKLVTETVVSLKQSYINKLHGTKSLKLVVSQSDNSLEVYELNKTSLSRVCRLSGHEKGLTEVVFSPKEDHLVYSAGQDGLVKLWDTRASGTCALEYKGDDEELTKPYDCMDVSCNGRVLCAGSLLVEDEAYLVFWDNRMPKPLGGYWNSHTDDIAQVKFHPQKPEILASGSLDNLINIYNVLEQTEDDALTYSFNVENSVERLSWVDEGLLACVTQSNDMQLWSTDTGDLVRSFDRDKIARSIKRSKSDDCYLVDTLSIDGTPVLLAGSHGGDGNTLRSVAIADKKLVPATNFEQNKQTVRCCWYEKDRDILVTSGESGFVSVWGRGRAAQEPGHAHKLTSSLSKLHVNRHKPY